MQTTGRWKAWCIPGTFVGVRLLNLLLLELMLLELLLMRLLFRCHSYDGGATGAVVVGVVVADVMV